MPRRAWTWTFGCGTARGTVPRPVRACARLLAGGAKLFAPLPKDAVCTEIYGGPQKARVVGTVNGRRVHATFTRTNGCEISRWQRISPWLCFRRRRELAPLPSAAVKTVLFVGAGRHQRRAIEQARARGLRVAAVDRNAEAPGLSAADVAEVVDFTDADEVVEVARRIGVDGVLTVSADRAVPVVAAVAEALGLPGIGTGTAHLLTHKRAMRDALGASGLPQPPYA